MNALRKSRKQVAERFTLTDLVGEANSVNESYFQNVRFDPVRYIKEMLHWTPWRGTPDRPGQQEVLESYALALRQQHERKDWERGYKDTSDLLYWHPGDVIQNNIRVAAGHTVGKTKVAAGVLSHFFDCFSPAIVYSFAPTWPQIKDLLWKEIAVDRAGKSHLRGTVLDTCQIKYKSNHFAKGRATNDAKGRGTERVQGQHNPYLLFVLDEAEGIDNFVWDAVASMASGGIVIVLMLANPRTSVSKFYKAASSSSTVSHRISCLWHPNVISDKEIISGAVRRDYVRKMLEEHASVVSQHDSDKYTFELEYPIKTHGTLRPRGTIFLPDNDFLFRVLGITPANTSVNTIIPTGRYDAAINREVKGFSEELVHIGVDVARFGNDFGTVYVSHKGHVWRAARLNALRTYDYIARVKQAALDRLRHGAIKLSVRVDGTGGWGVGVIDGLLADEELTKSFEEVEVIEVVFNAVAHDPKAYGNLITEMYFHAAESLKGVCIRSPVNELKGDLTEREYRYVNRKGRPVRLLEEKSAFKSRMYRSPDDGDGFVMCVAPRFIFPKEMPNSVEQPAASARVVKNLRGPSKLSQVNRSSFRNSRDRFTNRLRR